MRLHQKSLTKETRDVAGSSLLSCFHMCLPELENSVSREGTEEKCVSLPSYAAYVGG